MPSPAAGTRPMPRDPDILVDLTTAASGFEAEVIASALEAHGVPARAFAGAGNIAHHEVAASQPFRVQVRRRDLDHARELLDTIRRDHAGLDWDQIDVGEAHGPEHTVDTHASADPRTDSLTEPDAGPHTEPDAETAFAPPTPPPRPGPQRHHARLQPTAHAAPARDARPPMHGSVPPRTQPAHAPGGARDSLLFPALFAASVVGLVVLVLWLLT